jgi:hypothetical protein
VAEPWLSEECESNDIRILVGKRNQPEVVN